MYKYKIHSILYFLYIEPCRTTYTYTSIHPTYIIYTIIIESNMRRDIIFILYYHTKTKENVENYSFQNT